MTSVLFTLRPAASIVLLTVSFLLVAWELNRPGSILPGALGVLGVLSAVAALTRFSIRPLPLCLLGGCVLLLGGNLLWRLPLYLIVLATAGLVGALRGLVGGAEAVPWVEAGVCGTVLGAAGGVLARIALRARRAKQVN